MPAWLIAALVSFLTGGAFGSILTELFRRRRAKTRTIPLIELVNRNPLLYELKGIQLVKKAEGDKEGQEVTNIRHYQLLLRNTSGIHLRGSEIQFKFRQAEEIVPWVSTPAVSKTELIQVTPAGIDPPWQKAFRWRVPQFPDGDSVEFGFQAINPISNEYEAFLDSSENVILRRTTSDPLIEPRLFWTRNLGATIGSLIAGAAVVSALSGALTGGLFQRFLLRESVGQFSVTTQPPREGYTIQTDLYNVRVFSGAERSSSGWKYTYRVENLGKRPVAVNWTDPAGLVLQSATLPAASTLANEMESSLTPQSTRSDLVLSGAGLEHREQIIVLRPETSR